MLLGLARAVTLGSKSRRTHGHILLSHLRLPQHGRPGPRIYIPQEQGGPVIPPRALGSLFFASYDSQGYGGGILTRLHTGHTNIVWYRLLKYLWSSATSSFFAVFILNAKTELERYIKLVSL
jgi:hypothetical protein